VRPVALTVATWIAALTLPLAVGQAAGSAGGDSSSHPTSSDASCSGTHWVATWTASPSDAFASVPLADQTIRQQIFTHYAGSTLRLHLTNRFSTAPVTFGAVTIGVQSSGAAIRTGTLRTVRFGGKPTLTLPAHGERISDPIHLGIRALQTLDVSMYVELAARPTEHFISQSTSWATLAGTGDHTQDLTGAAFPVATPVPGVSYPDLPQGIDYTDALDVRAPRSVGTVVTFGDSITDGFQGSLTAVTPTSHQLNKNSRWPDDLARRLHAAHQAMSVANAGISGNTLVYPPNFPILGPTGVTRFRRDALGVAGVSEVIVLLGINDVGGVHAPPMIAGYKRLITMAHRAGVPIYLGTLTPDGGELSTTNKAGDLVKAAVNSWIRHQHLSDGVIDFARAVEDPSDHSKINPTYDGGDHLHFSAAGYRAMARAVPLNLLTPRTCSR
jgi:lysophospholipase L1-like esterase